LNLFITAALILADPSMRWLAVVGMVEIAVVVALTVTTRSPVQSTLAGHGHGDHGHGGHAAEPHGAGHGAGTHEPTSPPVSPVIPGAAATSSH
jgi:NADH-quinone oxidoreductase subunit H